MNDEPIPNKGSSTAAWAAVLVMLPLVYMLSMGPVGYVVQRFSVPATMHGPALKFYGPVIWLHDHTSLKGPIESYLEWWDRLARRP